MFQNIAKLQETKRKDLLKYVADYVVVCWEFFIKIVQLTLCRTLSAELNFLPVLRVIIAQFFLANFCADVHRMSALRIGAMGCILCVMA